MNKNINNNGYDYVDLGLPSGTLWATCNIGATKPNEPGLYFQWGSIKGDKEIVDKLGSRYKWKYYDNTKEVFTKYTTTNAPLELDDDAAYKIMGGDWHIPSTNQIQELFDNTIRNWTSIENVLGVIFISKKDKSKFIFIPIYNDKYTLSLWSSETYDKCEEWANTLHINPVNLNISVTWAPRSCQFPIRGVIDDISKTPYKCNYDQRHIWKLELDLVGILKNVPKGTKLYSPICGECKLDKIVLPDSECTWIGCRLSNNHSDIIWFSSEGIYAGYENGECMLFPSKYNRNWANFEIPKV